MPRTIRSVRTCAAVAIVAGAAAWACGSSGGPKPAPTLASSPEASVWFDEIRGSWRNPDRTTPAALRDMLQRFVARFPDDGLVPLARVQLALVLLDANEFAEADRQIGLTSGLEPGTARDLRDVARARRLRLRGEAEAAMDVLRPLVGKNVDPIGRALFEEEMTLSALATRRDYEAISYMDVWLRFSAEEEKEQTAKRVAALVERLPKEVLVAALEAMRTQRATLGYGVDIERILAERLVKIATTSGDATLARMLLDPDAGAIVVSGDAGAQLGELATSRRGMNVVQGRTIGLLLPTESPALRDESADVLRGVMWALGLPRGVREGDRERANDSGVKPSESSRPPPAGCASLEPAPPPDEPRAEDRVRLVTRDDAGNADRTEVALDELAGEGASIVIAGLDAQTSERALRWGDNHGVAVVAVVPPTDPAAAGAYGFVLGESRARVVEALVRAMPALGRDLVAPVVDASEVAFYPAQGGLAQGMTLLPPVSCDIPPARAGDPRFPVAQWDRDKARAWLVSGSPECARDLWNELGNARAQGTMAATLEAASLPAHAPARLRAVSASAGMIPAGEARDEELRRFVAALGRATWWTALGRDAATLARAAELRTPVTSATESKDVAARRSLARERLASARARLWSTEAAGWTDGHTMKRTVCAIGDK